MATMHVNPESTRRVSWPVLSNLFMQDDMALLDHYGMGEEERLRRKAFLEITEADSKNLRSLRQAFREFGHEFAEGFYHHLLSHPATASLLKDPQQVEELKKLQAAYFSELLEGIFDEAYIEGRLRVGLAHQRIGLDPAWYLGAYNQYIQLTFPFFAKAFGNDLDKVLPLLLSLVKVIFLDIGLALRTYFQSATEQLRHHNEELKQALGLYWQAQRREEQLRKIISHEIRGGLAAMITSLEDLTDLAQPRLDAAAVEQLESVTKRCWSLSGLLGEMLTSEDRGGPTWVDTAQIFNILKARFGMYSQGRSIDLLLPEHAPRVWADPIQLREVFANLVSNAVRYMDKEPGRIEISCRPEGEFYVFCVADNGPGIPANVMARIFEPFVRGQSAASGKDGTGLGLFFVRTMIEQGGGKVWLDTSPGQGSRFSFTVPRVPPTLKTSEASTSEVSERHQAGS